MSLALAAAAIALTGCGAQGNPAPKGEKEHDIEVLNVAITQELTLIDAYRAVGARVHAPAVRAVMRRYVAQELEHVDALTKAMRGLGGTVEAEAEAIDVSGLRSRRDYLVYAYEQAGMQLTHFLEAIPQLSTPAPESIVAAAAANMAQHLVVFRRLLGANTLESVPDSFDTGEVPPPGAPPTGRR